MKTIEIKGVTRIVGEGQGYLGLALRDGTINDSVTGPGTPMMESLWVPSAEELQLLNEGRGIKMLICGTIHPPCILSIADEEDMP